MLLATAQLVAQNKLKPVFTNPDFRGKLYLDHLGNLYTVEGNNVISKYDQNLNKLYSVTEKLQGELTLMDVSNPFRIYLYFEDQNVVLINDNEMKNIGRFDLASKGFRFVPVICRASNNGLWLYDEQEQKLKRLDNTLRKTIESNNLFFYTDEDVNPNYMVEDEDFLYLNNPQQGIMIFDLFGKYYKTIAVPNLDFFQVLENKILYIRNNSAYVYDLQTLEENPLNLPLNIPDPKQVLAGNKRYYILSRDGLSVYSY